MGGILVRFKSLRFLYRVIFYILFIVVLGGIYFYAVYSPLKEQIENARQEYDSLTSEISRIKPVTANYEQFKKEVELLVRQFNMLLEILPNEKSYNLIYDQMVTLAEKNGLKVTLFQPTDVRSIDDFHSAVNFNMNVEGEYLDFVRFLHGMSYLSKVINVNNFTLTQKKGQDGKIVLSVNMSMNSYMFNQATGSSGADAPKKAGGMK